jgi:hypothetical protein
VRLWQSERKQAIKKLYGLGGFVSRGCTVQVLAKNIASLTTQICPSDRDGQIALIKRFVGGDEVKTLPPLKPLRQSLAERLQIARAREYHTQPGFTDRLK